MVLDQLNMIENYIEKYNINLVNLIYSTFTITIVIFGSLISLLEPYMPSSIRQSFRYGKHSYKGPNNKIVSNLEVPKGWFKHFYLFAFAWSFLALTLLMKSLITLKTAPEPVLMFLDIMGGGRANRKVELNTTSALVGIVLMTMQCVRRFYETHFVQIFSKKSKINLSHYLVGYIHYFGVFVALLANTQGFVRGSNPTPFQLSRLNYVDYLCIFIFHMAWIQQYKANMILVNMRMDKKTGKVATEAHLIPRGGFFEYVSSPHMLFEIIMYLALLILMRGNSTFIWIGFWVVSNQCINALLTHRWYKENFKNYPTDRTVLVPFIF